jgi:hypothetical protein
MLIGLPADRGGAALGVDQGTGAGYKRSAQHAVYARGAGRDPGQMAEVPAPDHHIMLENPTRIRRRRAEVFAHLISLSSPMGRV